MEFQTKTHTLLCPVDVPVKGTDDNPNPDPIKVTAVTVSTPKGRAMRSVARLAARAEADPVSYTDVDMSMDSLQLMSDMPPGGVDELHPRDLKVLGEMIAPFLVEALGGGDPSSPSPDGMSETETE